MSMQTILKGLWPWQGPEERTIENLLDGRLRGSLDCPSLILFTVPRCAATYVKGVLAQVAVSQGAIPIDFQTPADLEPEPVVPPHVSPEFSDFFRGTPTSITPALRHEMEQRIPSRGFCYASIPGNPFFSRLPHFEQFKALLVLRDPRDVATSLYYGVAYGHNVPPRSPDAGASFCSEQERVTRMGIDPYVLEVAPWLARTYHDYCTELLGRPNVLMVKYEDLVYDVEPWLEQVFQFWGLARPRKTANRLSRSADFEVSREDPYRRKRQVQPGDHRRKLKPETIDQLDETFQEVLHVLGYARMIPPGRAAETRSRGSARKRQRMKQHLTLCRHGEVRPTDVFVASYPRSGNTWSRVLLADAIEQSEGMDTDTKLPICVDRVIPDLDRGDPLDHDPGVRLPFRLIKTHSRYHLLIHRAIVILRLPAVSLCSYYHYHRHFLPELCRPGETVDQFCHEHLPVWLDHVQSYLSAIVRSQAHVFLTTYEQLHAEPTEVLAGMLRFLGLPDDPSVCRRAVEQQTFEKHCTRKVFGEELTRHFFRRGKVDGGHDELSPETAAWIDQTATPLYHHATTLLSVGAHKKAG